MKSQFIKLYLGLVLSVIFAVVVLQSLLLNTTGDAQDELFAQQFRAYYQLAIQSGDDPIQQMTHMRALAEQMGADIEQVDQAELYPDEDQALARAGMLVVNSDIAFTYFRLPDQTAVYRFQYRADNPLLAKLSLDADLTMIGIFLALGAVLAIWVYFLSAKLNGLNIAARKLAAGDLSARAPSQKNQQVGQLNSSFNLMAERIEQLLTSHKQLSNAIAHELRSPIFRLQCEVDLLRDATTSAERDKYINGIGEDVQELSDLVEELLQHAKMENAQYRLQQKHQDIVVWLSTLLQRLQTETALPIYFVHVPDRCNLRFDANLLQRAVQNILRNAFRFAANTIEIQADLEPSSLLIHIDDDGPGIADEQKEAVFRPFHRIDSARSRNDARNHAAAGYGLGLAIARQAIELHGGELTLTDSPLGGARFSVRLPR